MGSCRTLQAQDENCFMELLPKVVNSTETSAAALEGAAAAVHGQRGQMLCVKHVTTVREKVLTGNKDKQKQRMWSELPGVPCEEALPLV